jgi:2-oxoglutarate dehydrogenase E1 component
LQSAADINFRLANCTTAAQYFHLLRRQAALLQVDPLPLIVLTPKSLLRNPLVASSPRELAEGYWQQVIDDEDAAQHPDLIERIIVCSGKIYFDLISSDLWKMTDKVAIIRIEQLYRFPEELLRQILNQYPQSADVVWVQEEPQNMGAWIFVAPRLQKILGDQRRLGYIGRERSASPAEGSSALHAVRQAKIIEKSFDLQQVPVKEV